MLPLVAALSAVAASPEARALDDRIPELQSSPCLWPVLELLNDWGSAFAWRRLDVEVPVYGSPTATTGVWTIVHVDGANVVVRRVSAPSQIAVRFDAGCRRQLSTEEAPSGSLPGGFDDADLDALRRKKEPVLVYAWSPHMPLSVSGLKEARAAAAAAGIEVIGVLDPGAARSLAEDTARREGLPAADLEPLVSTELVLRGMTTHFPAATLLRAGEIGELRRGFERAESWKRHFDAVLARTEPPR